MARPALITLTILSFQGSWNEFPHTLVAVQSPQYFTLPRGLADLVSGSLGAGTQYPLKLGAALLATIPVAISSSSSSGTSSAARARAAARADAPAWHPAGVASDLLASLGVTLPVLAAPMAGGPGTPALVDAAAAAGSLGFVAGGYSTPDALAADLAAVSSSCAVNLFAPNPVPVDPAEFRRYADLLAPEASRYGLALAGADPVEDDDHWSGKLEVLRARSGAAVSFTFGIPGRADLSRCVDRRPAGPDRDHRRGGPGRRRVRSRLPRRAGRGRGRALGHPRPAPPVGFHVAARPRRGRPGRRTAAGDRGRRRRHRRRGRRGGTGRSGRGRRRHAAAAQRRGRHVGHPSRRVGRLPPDRVTHAFTGRPARGLRNEFIDRYESVAPYGYPALHHLTAPLRRASAAAGDPERVHLWAGTGYRHATDEPAAAILTRLAAQLA